MSAPPWTPEQDAVLWDRAGLVPPEELARLISEVGPARGRHAVVHRAWQLGISLAKRSKRQYEWSRWTPPEIAVVQELAGRVTLEEITRRLNERFGTRRRSGSVANRLSKLGLSGHVDGLLTAWEVRAILRIDTHEVKQRLEDGEIQAEIRCSGKGGLWGVRPEALEAYMRAHPERLKVQLMQPGRWRDLAIAITRRSPFLSPTEAAGRAGIALKTLWRWLEEGRVSGAIKYRNRWRIPASSEIWTNTRNERMIDRLLTALSSEAWASVADLARMLDVSEMCVRSAIQRARRYGYSIAGLPGRGYRLGIHRERAGQRMAS